jgi:hypothetical protein
MLIRKLRRLVLEWWCRGRWGRWALLGLYFAMTVQFVSCYMFLVHPYVHLDRYAHGYERLPFQTRLLLAPVFQWAQASPRVLTWAAKLWADRYFFPSGVGPGGLLEFLFDVPCVVVAGLVAVRIYHAASRRQLLGWMVYPLFLVLCTAACILHTVQNFRFVYDLPSLAFFAVGLYLIYFRKPVLLLAVLFAVATWSRETTLFLIPFYLLSECVRPRGDETLSSGHVVNLPVRQASHLDWRRALRAETAVPATLMLLYWVAWHIYVFHLFRHNVSEYYPRVMWNLRDFVQVRYWAQLLSAFGFLLPVLLIFRRNVRDAQLRAWTWIVPCWYAVMAVWRILVETRIFGELLPFVACAAALIAEEALAAALARSDSHQPSEQDERTLVRAA